MPTNSSATPLEVRQSLTSQSVLTRTFANQLSLSYNPEVIPIDIQLSEQQKPQTFQPIELSEETTKQQDCEEKNEEQEEEETSCEVITSRQPSITQSSSIQVVEIPKKEVFVVSEDDDCTTKNMMMITIISLLLIIHKTALNLHCRNLCVTWKSNSI